MFRNLDPCPADFLASLKSIPAVSEKNGAVLGNEQQGCTARETSQVEDVREVGDYQPGGVDIPKNSPEPFETAPGRALTVCLGRCVNSLSKLLPPSNLARHQTRRQEEEQFLRRGVHY